MKILLMICDGMGDRPCPGLKGKTPLEAARKPTMDFLAKNGQCGLMDVISPGIVPGSDTAHLALLGYDPAKTYTGRGPFEAAGLGLDVRKGDVAFRCNFATVDKDMKVLDRRAGRISEGTDKLAAAINGMKLEDVEVLFKEAVEHRAVLVLRGAGLSPSVSDADPHQTGTKILTAKALKPEAEKTARILNEFVKKSYQILSQHDVNKARERAKKLPANIILPRGAGSPPDVPSFSETHNGLRGAAVVGISLVKGVCRIAGMDVLDVRGATGGKDTDLKAKASAALRALVTRDFVLLHIKATDVFGHDNDPAGKAEFIQKIDSAIKDFTELEDTIVCITADHSTPCSVKEHASDPVPVLIWGKGLRRDNVEKFGELEAACGGLGHLRGHDLVRILTGLAGRSGKFGA